jgi:hypothetical protein
MGSTGFLLLVMNATAGLAQPKKPLLCSLTKPSTKTQGTNLKFQITLDCDRKGSGRSPFPSQTDVWIGLTLYKPSASDAKPTSTPSRKSITDQFTPKFDLPVQQLRPPQSTGTKVVTFTAKAADIVGKTHLLFAAWPLSARQQCMKGKFARSGCLRYGYVLESPVRGADGIQPLASYPGLVIDESGGDGRGGGSIRQPRWIVERFRD